MKKTLVFKYEIMSSVCEWPVEVSISQSKKSGIWTLYFDYVDPEAKAHEKHLVQTAEEFESIAEERNMDIDSFCQALISSNNADFNKLGLHLKMETSKLDTLELVKKPKPIRSVEVCVSWGNEQYKCPMSEKTWHRIVKGKLVRRIEHYHYEGKKYKSEWLFNSESMSSLVVNYEDGGVGFDGVISDALIWVRDEKTSWILELMKYGSSDDLLDALVERSTNQDNSPPPYEYWVIEDSFVCEPNIGGQLIGEISKINLNTTRLLRISQDECDSLMEAVYREEGTYPDT